METCRVHNRAFAGMKHHEQACVVLLVLINDYKSNATVILAIVSGLGMILTKN